jgi:hypothetical protein
MVESALMMIRATRARTGDISLAIYKKMQWYIDEVAEGAVDD